MRRHIRDFRERLDSPVIAARGMLRRVTVAMTGALWQLLGYEDEDGNKETFNDAEVFGGIGFRSRPKVGSKAEAITASIGGENGHTVVIATRDLSIEVDLDEDEVAIFNSTGKLVKVTKAGTVELGGAGLGATDGVVHGTGIDPWTGMTYAALGSTSSIVKAKK